MNFEDFEKANNELNRIMGNIKKNIKDASNGKKLEELEKNTEQINEDLKNFDKNFINNSNANQQNSKHHTLLLKIFNNLKSILFFEFYIQRLILNKIFHLLYCICTFGWAIYWLCTPISLKWVYSIPISYILCIFFKALHNILATELVCPICHQNFGIEKREEIVEKIKTFQELEDDECQIVTYDKCLVANIIICKYCSHVFEKTTNEEDIYVDYELTSKGIKKEEEERKHRRQMREIQNMLEQQAIEQERRTQEILKKQQQDTEHIINQQQYSERIADSIRQKQQFEENFNAQCERQKQQVKEQEKQREKDKRTICFCKQQGERVLVFNARNECIFNKTGTLVGYTQSSVSVKHNGFLTTYDGYGRVIDSRRL